MLEYIRSNSQSFGVKLAFGVIILVFVFWGVGSLKDSGSSNLVAVVNGDSITAREFEMAYRNAEESMLRNNPGVSRDQIKQGLGRQVLRELVSRTLLRQEAERAGVTIPPLELRMAVGKMPVFQNAQGKFDPEAYTRVLGVQRTTAAKFERDLSEDLLDQKVQGLVTSSVWINPMEAQNRYTFLREKRVVDYIFVPAAKFMAGATPSASEVTEYYEAHKTEFATPAKAQVAYIRVAPENLVKADAINETDARRWYEANIARFTQEDQVKAAHILVPLAEDAPDADVNKAQESMRAIEAELKSGKSFAAVADAHNGPQAAGPGGELGWIKRGTTVKPFEDAAFALEAGALSGPVRSRFGLHIIKVEEKKAGGSRAFAEVANDVRKAMAQEQGVDKLRDVLDNLIEENILGKPLEKSAQALGLEAQETGMVPAAELQATLGITPADAAALVAAQPGAPMDRALEAGDAYIVARVLMTEPASTEKPETVNDRITTLLRNQKAQAEAMKAAAERRKTLVDAPAAISKTEARTADPMERSGILADFGPEPELSAAVFSAGEGTWLPSAFAVNSAKEGPGAVLLHVRAVQAPDAEEWNGIQDIMTSVVQRERAEGLFETFMQRLFSKARLELHNADLVDRKNM